MATEILNRKSNIDFYCVDVWEKGAKGLPNETLMNESFFKNFLRNTEIVKEQIIPIRKSSVEASTLFEDKSCHFVFIDGSHEYQDVCNDILSWTPKNKKNGFIAGDDYIWDTVKKAVNELLPNAISVTTKNFTPSGWPSKYWIAKL